MARFFVFVLILLCGACAKDHGKPIASLSYDGIMARPHGVGLYELSFKSDIDLLNLFGRGEGFIGGMLYCALAEDTDFSVGRAMQMSGRGVMHAGSHGNKNDGFTLTATLSFKETLDKGRSARILSSDEIRMLLAGKESIPCQYVATVFNHKPYHSGILMVPAEDILAELDE